MNNQIILNMVEPYINDSSITYDQFDHIFNLLSLKEQYEVTDILYKSGINLVDEEERIDNERFVLEPRDSDEDDIDEDDNDDDFKVLYDDSLFKDSGFDAALEELVFVNKNVKQSNEILCSLIQQGSKQAAQDLCMKNKRLVDKYVLAYQKRYRHTLEFEDLEQVGFVGLIKAAQRFDIKLGYSFSTYATWWIKQTITREIMDNGYAIRIPVHMMERINKTTALDNKYAYMSVDERVAKISEETGYSEEIIRECMILRTNVLTYASLNAPIGEDEESELLEFVPAEEVLSVEEVVENHELRRALELAMSGLTDREQKILRLRFGFDDGKPKTLESVGKEFGVTRERIRQIEAKALRKLRHPTRSRKLKDFLNKK